MTVAHVYTVAFQGIEAREVDVQVHVGDGGNGVVTIVGLADKAVAESRERVRSALSAIGLAVPFKRITVNLAPADLPKEGSHYDLPIALGLLAASRKLSIRDILAAIAIFANGAKGISALQLSRDLDVQYKTAFVMAHKLREAMAAGDKGKQVSGDVEIDGMYAGGYVKPANVKAYRRDRRLLANQSGKRQSVIVARERNGKTITFVAKSEAAAVPALHDRIAAGSTVYADEASHWDALHASYETRRVNHSEAYSSPEGCTNMAESFFSRLRRAEVGTYHHIAGPYLASYAAEMDWREDNRRVANGDQYRAIITAAAQHPVSRQWKGYWQRRAQ